MSTHPTDLTTPEQGQRLTRRGPTTKTSVDDRRDRVAAARRRLLDLKRDPSTLQGARDHNAAAFSNGVRAAVAVLVDVDLGNASIAEQVLDLRRDPAALPGARADCADCFSRGVRATVAALDEELGTT